jgi:hypothetical protein
MEGASMPDPNTPERQRLYRRIPCESCGRRHTGTHGQLCWECARQTPEGRAKVARLVWEHRQRRKTEGKGDNP